MHSMIEFYESNRCQEKLKQFINEHKIFDITKSIDRPKKIQKSPKKRRK